MFSLFLMLALWIPEPNGGQWQQHLHPVKVAGNLTEQQCNAAGKRALVQGRPLVEAYACPAEIDV